MRLAIYNLDVKEEAIKIIEKFKNKDKVKMQDDCLIFIEVCKNRVRKYNYTYFAEMEFDMEFLDRLRDRIKSVILK